MQEVNFKDRIPTHAGRVKLTPVEGQPDLFTMTRADEPTEAGTPLDKATFDSIIKSRLTGRFYSAMPFPTVKSTTAGNVTPLPTSNWVLNGITNATSSIYKVTASSAINENYSVIKAVDGDDYSNWGSVDGTTHNYTVIFPIALKIKKVRVWLGRTGNTTGFKMIVQGSNNGTSWTNLHTVTTFPSDIITYTLSTTGDYSQYRLYFEKPDGARVYITSLEFPEWEANSYTIDFLSSEMPTSWTIGQRVAVQIPEYAAFVVDSNTFNGVKVNTILLSGRKYELRYNGSTFDAKEV